MRIEGGFTYLGDPFQWFSNKLGTVDTEETECSLAWDTDGEELVVPGDRHVTDVFFYEIDSFFSIVNCSRICFVMDV